MAEEDMKDRTAAGEAPLHSPGEDGKEAPLKEAPGRKAGGGKAQGGTAGRSRKPAPEQRYTARELACHAGDIFGTRRECAEAALKSAGKQEYALEEAAEVIKQFLKKEVG